MAAHFMWQSLADTKVDLDRMAAAHMDLARFDFSWASSEATKGTYLYFGKLDSVLDAIKARGMRAVITVIETPAWANGGAGKFAPPTNPADYAHFMGLLAQHTAARSGMVWEIWNEPNDSHFWTTGPNPAQYAAMLKAAYAAVKANDSNATVLGGSIVFNDLPFLRGMYSAGAGNSFDALAIHPYTAGRAPTDTSNAWFSFSTSVPQFNGVMAAHGQSKPIWITEMGWSTAQVSDATRATYMKTAVAIARSWSNLRGFAAYTIRQTQYLQYGMITSGGAETLTWKAYASVQ
jgi:Cellulase (glycosyl hydrolase family 5).